MDKDEHSNYLFVADNNVNNTRTTIYRYYVSTNFSESSDYTEDDYFDPTLILDYST